MAISIAAVPRMPCKHEIKLYLALETDVLATGHQHCTPPALRAERDPELFIPAKSTMHLFMRLRAVHVCRCGDHPEEESAAKGCAANQRVVVPVHPAQHGNAI